VQARILSVDSAPSELYSQVPFEATLLRQLPGPNGRDDYWLAQVARPLRFAKNGADHEVRYIVLASRFVGQSIHPGVGRITVGIAYVLDEAQLALPAVDMSHCAYVAIGEADIGQASA
jgi:hypothetical protein